MSAADYLNGIGVKPADVPLVARLIGDQRGGLMSGTEMLRQLRAYYEADIREDIAREIEAVASEGIHASDEPVFVDAALVARGDWSLVEKTEHHLVPSGVMTSDPAYLGRWFCACGAVLGRVADPDEAMRRHRVIPPEVGQR
jgi:hypothetical protein